MIVLRPDGNPFEFSRGGISGVYWPNGKAIRDPSLTTGNRTAVFVCAGQSMMANSENTTYSPVNSAKIDNLSIEDGGIYEAKDPLIGPTLYQAGPGVGGNWLLRFADKLITANMFDRVILIPIAVRSSSVADWATGGALNPRLKAACAWCEFRGYDITAFLWQQGETDNLFSTPPSTYSALLMQAIATPRALGHDAPWFIGKSTYVSGVTSNSIRAAQTAVVNNVDIFQGGDTDALGASFRYDNTHWNSSGSNAASNLWLTAVDAVL